MRESELERKLKTAVEEANGLCWKFVSPGTRGVPDRICIFPNGRVAFVEMKSPGGYLSPLQKRRIDELDKRNTFVWVIDSEEKIKRFVERHSYEIYTS